MAAVPGMRTEPLQRTGLQVDQEDQTVTTIMLMVAAKLVRMAKPMQEPLELKEIQALEELMLQTLPRIEAEISQLPRQPSRPLRIPIQMPIGRLATMLLVSILINTKLCRCCILI